MNVKAVSPGPALVSSKSFSAVLNSSVPGSVKLLAITALPVGRSGIDAGRAPVRREPLSHCGRIPSATRTARQVDRSISWQTTNVSGAFRGACTVERGLYDPTVRDLEPRSHLGRAARAHDRPAHAAGHRADRLRARCEARRGPWRGGAGGGRGRRPPRAAAR